jgi:hypothetical protein
MQGNFSSSGGIPAIEAQGLGGADGVDASTDSGTAVKGVASSRGTGVLGSSETGIAIAALSNGDMGIGLRATATSGWAINAQSASGVGILGASDTNVGVQGICQSGYNFGVTGTGPNAGVAAFNSNNENAAYLASECCAAWLTGHVTVTGKLSKGGGGFLIDHPAAPGERYLSHAFVESDEMKNLYDGRVTTDDRGVAVVDLPAWLHAANQEFRYQLTPIGGSAPELHIAEEITGGRFVIAGARPGMTVCWQVTGVRCDAWALANPLVVEEEKRPAERGYYLHPELHGADATKGIGEKRHARPE